MDDNIKDALKDPEHPNQQAMVSLLANHLGMTGGLQKGMRITKAMWDEAAASAPWMDKTLARFTSVDPQTGDRTLIAPLSGVVLTPDQMHSMVDLAHQKLAHMQ